MKPLLVFFIVSLVLVLWTFYGTFMEDHLLKGQNIELLEIDFKEYILNELPLFWLENF